MSVKSFSFTDASSGTSTTVIPEGDSVTWRWDGPGTNHSVTSDPGSAMTFDSDATNPTHSHPVGDTFTVVFPTSGCFQYHCSVHASMHGQVQVGTGVCPPPPPPGGADGGGGGGGGNGPPPPPPPAPPVVDTTAPAFSAVRERSKKLVFTLSEPAKVTIRVRRAHKLVKTFHVSGKRGSNSFRLTHRGLKKGVRYAATITAVDGAGNVSPARHVTLKL
ncbi:MAG TPA: plastocyanin/azurin family copper-binding protein [Thermoleophilaceae bacterium]